MQTKLCRHCKIEKPHSEFWNRKDSRDGKSYSCIYCCSLRLGKRNPQTPEEIVIVQKQRTYDRNRRLSNPEIIKKHENNRMKSRYGITMVQYENMLSEQNGVCFLCYQPPRKGQRLHIDHCHNTKKVRKLLCQSCNMGLGSFRDNPDLMTKAISYLLSYK